MNVLSLNKVYKKFNDKIILDDINLDIEQGDIIGIVGPNGAGKTTLFKIISGLVSSDSGKVESKETISGVISNTPLYPYLTGKEHLKYIAQISNNKVDIKAIEKFINIGEGINSKVCTYSLGMKQRLALGIALINYPGILLLDEPTNGLDYNGITEFRNLIKELSSKRNKTIIISSHNLSEIEKLCTKIVFINNGKIINIDNKNNSERETSFRIKFYTTELDKLKKCGLIDKCDLLSPEVEIISTEENIKGILKYMILENIEYKNLQIVDIANYVIENQYNLYINGEKK